MSVFDTALNDFETFIGVGRSTGLHPRPVPGGPGESTRHTLQTGLGIVAGAAGGAEVATGGRLLAGVGAGTGAAAEQTAAKSAAKSAASKSGSALTSDAAKVAAAGGAAALLGSTDFWIRLAEGILGAALLLLGLRALTGGSGDPVAAARRTVKRAVKK